MCIYRLQYAASSWALSVPELEKELERNNNNNNSNNDNNYMIIIIRLARIGCSGMWRLRMWCLIIIAIVSFRNDRLVANNFTIR